MLEKKASLKLKKILKMNGEVYLMSQEGREEKGKSDLIILADKVVCFLEEIKKLKKEIKI